MFRLTQQSQALKERNTDTPIIPGDNSSKFSNAGIKQAINATVIGGATKPAATRQISHLTLEHVWREGSGRGRAQTLPRLLGSGV